MFQDFIFKKSVSKQVISHAAHLDSLAAVVMESLQVKETLLGCSDFIQGANKEQSS